jgi:hypothetical protein
MKQNCGSESYDNKTGAVLMFLGAESSTFIEKQRMSVKNNSKQQKTS